jgi:hypothetical protein
VKTAVIMPTIRVPQNIAAWMALLDPETDVVIIAGNAKSPHVDILDRLDEFAVPSIYLHPEQMKPWAIDEFMEPNHTHRRNFALLEAIKFQPDVLVTIDDDNFPYMSTWLQGVKALLTEPNRRPLIFSANGWWNPGNICSPRVLHRGFPLKHRDEQTTVELQADNERIGVVASLWLGDPDINAFERIYNDPQVQHVNGSVTLGKGVWAPFDSQSTALAGELAPLLYMWPGVGRYDDIWSSYVARAVMDLTGWYVTYGHPTVIQTRNPHNLIRDLKDELYGYEHTEELCDNLRGIVEDMGTTGQLRQPSVLQVFTEVTERLWDIKVIPYRTRESFMAWLEDLQTLHTYGNLKEGTV